MSLPSFQYSRLFNGLYLNATDTLFSERVKLDPIAPKHSSVGRLVKFICSHFEGDNVSFSWSRAGHLLHSDGRLTITNTVDSSTLKISNVRQSDSGKYVCIGSNELSEDRASAVLTVEGGHYYHSVEYCFVTITSVMCISFAELPCLFDVYP